MGDIMQVKLSWMTVLALCLNLLLLAACSEIEQNFEIFLELEPRLEVDDNGLYHLTLARDSWQTIHRLSGHISIDGTSAENVRVEWTSSHYWRLNDTLGYYVDFAYTDQLEYVSLDTTFITGFNDFVVPTINCCSYSNADGEVNTMIAPVGTMLGDTMSIEVHLVNSKHIGEILIVLD